MRKKKKIKKSKLKEREENSSINTIGARNG